MISFGNRVLADDQVKMRSFGQALLQYDYVHIKWGNLDTETEMHIGKMPCEHEDRD